MDLISHIPGVGPTASFTPGGNTPAPFNTTHVGVTDGTSPGTASKNMAEIYNRLMLQVASVIVKSGLTIDNANWAQLGTAVQNIANGSVQSLGISGQTLSISGGNSVTLPDADNQTLGLSGQTLSISGGNSVTLPSSGLGDGQNWSQPARSANTWYQNTTGKPIMVNIAFGSYGGGALHVGPSPGSAPTAAWTENDIHQLNQMSAIVPSGYYYYLANAGGASPVGTWFELS